MSEEVVNEQKPSVVSKFGPFKSAKELLEAYNNLLEAQGDPAQVEQLTKERDTALKELKDLKAQMKETKSKQPEPEGDNITVHKFKRGDEIWVADYRNDPKNIYSRVQDSFRFVPLKTTVRDVVVGETICYRIPKITACFREDYVKATEAECIELCERLNAGQNR